MLDKALTFSEFFSILSKSFIFEEKPHVAISFSGGPDSLALLILMKNWIHKNNGKITIVHFNHRIRRESEMEAKYVEELAKKFKVNCKVLNWNKSKKSNALMENARDERYNRIINFCREEQIITLMTAHHFDDCLETYLMRKKRKFTTLGLTGIPMINSQKNLQILRPFIRIKKKRLIQTCLNNNIKWIKDPSNDNEKFERVRIRKFIKKLRADKIKSLERELKENLKKNIIIEKRLSKFFTQKLTFYNYGKFMINKKSLLRESESFQIEIIKKILVTCSGATYPPRYGTVGILVRKIKNFEKFRFSIHSCIVSVENEIINIYREYQKIVESLPRKIYLKENSKVCWDSRFLIESSSKAFYCHVMNDKLWLKLKGKFESLKKQRNIKFELIKTLPIIQINKKFIIPYLSSNSDLIENSIKIMFNPKIPLTKKNF